MQPVRSLFYQPFRTFRAASCHALSTTPVFYSGHNRWSKIKHDKGKADARRGASFSKLSREIAAASRDGGPIPGDSNLRLTAVIAAAKKAGLAKDKITAAIQRGQGRSNTGTALESVVIEAVASGGVALLIEGMADNKLRMLQDVRTLLARSGAREGPVGYLFERVGIVRSRGWVIEELLEAALEWDGVEDVTQGEAQGEAVVRTTVVCLPEVEGRMRALAGGLVVGVGIEMVPKGDTMIDVSGSRAEELAVLVDRLEEYADVGDVWTNARVVTETQK